MVNLNGSKTKVYAAIGRPTVMPLGPVGQDFLKTASMEDQAIYKAIRDNYFKNQCK